MAEITLPQTVKFDFLLVLFGFSVIGFVFYFTELNQFLRFFILLGGVMLLYIGLAYMRADYKIEIMLKYLISFKQRNELLSYFKQHNLVTDQKYSLVIESLRKEINSKTT